MTMVSELKGTTGGEAGVDRLEKTRPVSGREGPSESDSSKPNRGDEDILRLVQQLFLVPTEEPPRVILFAGVDRGNGCSGTCAAVGRILAMNSHRPVCLVDANFRSPSLTEILGISACRGLTDSLVQTGPISSFTETVGNTNLWFLSAGTLAPNSPNLLSSEALRDRLLELRREFDFLIIDTPPLGQYSDALVLGQHSDGVVLVLKADSTRRESASAAVASLRAANVNVLAAVLNGRSFPIPEKLYKRL